MDLYKIRINYNNFHVLQNDNVSFLFFKNDSSSCYFANPNGGCYNLPYIYIYIYIYIVFQKEKKNGDHWCVHSP